MLLAYLFMIRRTFAFFRERSFVYSAESYESIGVMAPQNLIAYMSYKIASVSLVRHANMHSVRPPAPEICGWDSLQHCSHDPVQHGFGFARRRDCCVIDPPYLFAVFGASETTIFSKRGSLRRESHIGFSLRSP